MDARPSSGVPVSQASKGQAIKTSILQYGAGMALGRPLLCVGFKSPNEIDLYLQGSTVCCRSRAAAVSIE